MAEMFDREWFKTELDGLRAQLAQTIVQLHQIEGAIQVLEQMERQLGGVDDSTPLLDDVLAEAGLTVEEVIPLNFAGAQEFEVQIPGNGENDH